MATYTHINIGNKCLEFDSNFTITSSEATDQCPCGCGYKIKFVGQFANAIYDYIVTSGSATQMNFGGVGLSLLSLVFTQTLPAASMFQAGRNYLVFMNGVKLALSEYTINNSILQMTSVTTVWNAGDMLTLIPV